MRRTESKFCIGYIPDLGELISFDSVIKHLMEVCDFNITRAKQAIKEFTLHIEQEYWREFLEPIKHGFKHGYKIHILGHGVKTIYPVIPFAAGDDPALHRMFCFSKAI